MHNYFAVLLRNLRREKLYAAINIAGLSLGIACCLILGLFLRSELTYDRYQQKHDRIYRVVAEYTTGGTSDQFAVTSRMLGAMLKADYPEVQAFVRFQHNGADGGTVLRHGDDVYFWENSYFVDESIFEVFSHDILAGDPKTALKDGNTIAVSQSFAKKYFGDADPMGQTVTTDSGNAVKIALVFADQPANTHVKYDVLFSQNQAFLRDPDLSTMRRQQLWNVGVYTYLLMAPGFDPKTWPRINDEFYKRNMEEMGKQIQSHWRSWLQPLTSIHLQSDVGYDLPTGNRLYLYGCAAVALFILVVACINYMNLATARASRRARSVGIRKILGASRLSLGLQFLGEALLFSLLALLLGVMIVEVALRFTPINALMGGQVELSLLAEPALAGWLLGLGVLMGLLSGVYPAIYLSSWAPLTALTGKSTGGKGNLRFRELLVLLQFTISAAVIACTLLMAAQMRYVANKSLGFDRENRLVVTLRGMSTLQKIPSIRSELAKNAHVLGIAQADVMIGQPTPIHLIQVENNTGGMDRMSLRHMPVGDDFLQVMGIKLLDGRDFSKKLLTDLGTRVIVNETLTRKMGWTQPIGKRLMLGGGEARVVGVVQDFNFRSLHTLIEPFAMHPLQVDFSRVPPIQQPFMRRRLVVSVSADDIGETLGYIERVVTQADPKHPFEYEFLDEQLDELYKAERQLTKLIGLFASVCIFIACLGLFGLAAFATEQRTREIGTRKVLGATTMQIILLLVKRIMLLVVIASMLASVLAYFAIDEWLAGFAYRAGINPLVFLLSAIAAAAVAFSTVALQSFRTAHADPVDALRHV